MLPLLLAALAATPAEPIDLAAARLLSRATSSEPSVEEVQRAARDRGGGRAPAWRRRARLAALVPKVSAEYRQDDRRYRTVGLTSGSEVDYVRHTPGHVISLRLAWELPDLVFADAELRAAAQLQAQEKARDEAVQRATRLYYERQRLRLAVAAEPSPSARERAERELAIEELGAELDLLTGGLYSGGRR
jgi:hypothetical protein